MLCYTTFLDHDFQCYVLRTGWSSGTTPNWSNQVCFVFHIYFICWHCYHFPSYFSNNDGIQKVKMVGKSLWPWWNEHRIFSNTEGNKRVPFAQEVDLRGVRADCSFYLGVGIFCNFVQHGVGQNKVWGMAEDVFLVIFGVHVCRRSNKGLYIRFLLGSVNLRFQICETPLLREGIFFSL